VAGSVSWAILSAGGSVVVEGEAPVRDSDHGLHGAIAAIGRAGFFDAYGRLRHALGTTAASVTRPDGAPCHDSSTVVAPALSTDEITLHGISVALGGGYEPAEELLRTGCPGPPRSDVFGNEGVASGALRPSTLGRRSIELPMSGSGRFASAGYSGAWTSRFSLGLRRVALRVTYGPVRVFR
jgi:hypothetical protein